MRLHIDMDPDLVARIDRVAGARGRSKLVRDAVHAYLDDLERWEKLESLRGAIPDHGHEWDDDPAEWVRRQRAADSRRVG